MVGDLDVGRSCSLTPGVACAAARAGITDVAHPMVRGLIDLSMAASPSTNHDVVRASRHRLIGVNTRDSLLIRSTSARPGTEVITQAPVRPQWSNELISVGAHPAHMGMKNGG
jgi:hypothetical protein